MYTKCAMRGGQMYTNEERFYILREGFPNQNDEKEITL